MHKFSYPIAFILGLIAVAWTGAGFIGTSPIALGMTALIAIVIIAGALEVRRFRAATAGLVERRRRDGNAFLGRCRGRQRAQADRGR